LIPILEYWIFITISVNKKAWQADAISNILISKTCERTPQIHDFGVGENQKISKVLSVCDIYPGGLSEPNQVARIKSHFFFGSTE